MVRIWGGQLDEGELGLVDAEGVEHFHADEAAAHHHHFFDFPAAHQPADALYIPHLLDASV